VNLISSVRHFFTSDPHFGDPGVLAVSRRPFASAQEADEVIVERWNAEVRPDDVVWLLGDVTTDTGPGEHLARLNGRIYLVAGNHDRCFAGFTPDARERERQIALYREAGVKAVVDGSSMLHRQGRPVRVPLRGGPPVDLSHFPRYPDPWRAAGEPDPWQPWRPRVRRGEPESWLVHGHVHTADDFVVGRHVNVALDMWNFTPVEAEAVASLIEMFG
jgi:calcineurin-like phosphoesterase family protein